MSAGVDLPALGLCCRSAPRLEVSGVGV